MHAHVLHAAVILACCSPWPSARAYDIQYTLQPAKATPIKLVGCDCGCNSDRCDACNQGSCCDAGCCDSCGGDSCGCDSCQQDLCCDSCDDVCCCGPSLYASVNLRGSFDHLQSGGFNTFGGFPNTGSDNGDAFSIGGALGVAIPRNFGTLRIECEGLWVDPFNTVTNSFAPPVPTFFYRAETSDRWAVLGNFWYDVPLTSRLDLYAGGGIGGGGATMTLDDSVVQGSGSSTDVVWQVGGGLVWQYKPRVSVDLGYRYMDWGTSTVDLNLIGGGPSAGRFTADVTSHQVFLGIRYNSLGDLFSR